MLALNGSMIAENNVALVKIVAAVDFQSVLYCHADGIGNKERHTACALGQQLSLNANKADRVVLVFVDVGAECGARHIGVDLIADGDNAMPDHLQGYGIDGDRFRCFVSRKLIHARYLLETVYKDLISACLISRTHCSLIDHIDFYGLVGRDKLIFVLVTAIMRWLQLFPQQIALFVYVPLVDGCGDDLTHDHETMQPLLGPFDLAFKVTSAFRYARRSHDRRAYRGERSLLELIDSRSKFKSNNSDFFENLPLKGRNVDDKLLGCQNIVVSIFGGAGRERNVYRIMAHSHAGAIRGGVDPAFRVHRSYHNETGARRKQAIPMLHRNVGLFVHRFTSAVGFLTFSRRLTSVVLRV